jgi:hypothetical protein
MDHAGVNEPYDERQSESELSDTYQDEKDWKNGMDKRTETRRVILRLPRSPETPDRIQLK